ncbi:MAG: hypothetical protein ABJH68_10240 [Ilumatobacter sp.]|uniref:hypothetical protein n=1 Tax=Ilumatobacter sp. TaxID=1967498 RepID=UPI003297F35A
MDTEKPKAADTTYVKTWRFDLDGTPRELRLEWTYWSGRRTVDVDGERLAESATWFTWKTTQRVDVAGHACVVRTEPSWLLSPLFRITLEVDGRVIEPEAGSTFWETKVPQSRAER